MYCTFRVLPHQLCFTAVRVCTISAFCLANRTAPITALLRLLWLLLKVCYQGNSGLLKTLWCCLCKYNHKWVLEAPQLGRIQTTLHALSQTVVLDLPSGKVKDDCSLETGKHAWNRVWMPKLFDHNYTYCFTLLKTAEVSVKWLFSSNSKEQGEPKLTHIPHSITVQILVLAVACFLVSQPFLTYTTPSC